MPPFRRSVWPRGSGLKERTCSISRSGVPDASGNFYGTTIEGGTGGNPDNTPSGTLTTLFNFDNNNNQNPGGPQVGALVQASDGNFYGLTVNGGSGGGCGTAGCGTLYKITPSGTLTVVYSLQATQFPTRG